MNCEIEGEEEEEEGLHAENLHVKCTQTSFG